MHFGPGQYTGTLFFSIHSMHFNLHFLSCWFFLLSRSILKHRSRSGRVKSWPSVPSLLPVVLTVASSLYFHRSLSLSLTFSSVLHSEFRIATTLENLFPNYTVPTLFLRKILFLFFANHVRTCCIC